VKSGKLPKTLGYMIRWTTYGTWLQGDNRGYVKNGKILSANQELSDSNKQNLTKKPVKLSKAHQEIVIKAIHEKASQLKHKIHALAVSYNHVHIVIDNTPEPIGNIVKYYKMAGQVALRKVGISGRIWTLGFDKRYCFYKQTLKKRIYYVNSHTNSKYKQPLIN
jgi:REP element-mobilizing transposase RayT